MSVVTLRNIFNLAADGSGMSCRKVTLSYTDGPDQKHGWQSIVFNGNHPDGTAFSHEMLAAPDANPEAIARMAALEMMDGKK